MAVSKSTLASICLFVLLGIQVQSGDTSPGGGSDDSIPILASGKRQHNIMRFGKRPAGGHNLIHFGKRGDNPKPQHSFLYFGKRDNERSLPDLIQYLQKSRDNSYKRGHAIMRFGKRDQGSHSFIRFGRPAEDEDYESYYPVEDDQPLTDEDKRNSHSMLYFGKRGTGHSMMYFGKRGGHSMMYFGKRGGHNMLSFGKRDDDKRAHSMIHFGKREGYGDNEGENYEDKRAHSMIHFGKKEYPFYDNEESKRGSHSMIHFGKREFDEDGPVYSTDAEGQPQLVTLPQSVPVHFDKRSVNGKSDQVMSSGESHKTHPDEDKDKSKNRKKREVDPSSLPSTPFVALIGYDANDANDERLGEDYLPGKEYHPQESIDLENYPDYKKMYQQEYPEYVPAYKKDASKNVFLRFG